MSDFETGITTFVLGLAVVFFGIAVLVAAVWAIGKILNSKKEKPASEEKAAAYVPAAEKEEEISSSVVAAIIAALQEYYASSGEKCEFTIRKINRRS